MPLHPVERWISEGEHLKQDFKFLVSDSRKIARTLVAFSNSAGGRLLIGVKDNGKIAGIRSEEELYMIGTAARHLCMPVVPYTSVVHRIGSKTVLEVNVESASDKPVRLKESDGTLRAYVRWKDNDLLADAVLMQYWKSIHSVRPATLAFTETESALLAYLSENPEGISISAFSRMCNLPRRRAIAILSRLLSWNVLHFVPGPAGLRYVPAETNSILNS
jgi:hypothetical protein